MVILSINSKEWGHLSSTDEKMEGSTWAEREKELVPLGCRDNFCHRVMPLDWSWSIKAEHLDNQSNCWEVMKTSWRKLRQISAVSWLLWVKVCTMLTNAVGSNPLIKLTNVNWEGWYTRDHHVLWTKRWMRDGCWELIVGQTTDKHWTRCCLEEEIICCWIETFRGQVQMCSKDSTAEHQMQPRVMS